VADGQAGRSAASEVAAGLKMQNAINSIY